MRLTSVRFRLLLAPPQVPLCSSTSFDTYVTGAEYELEDVGHWVKITHKETGKVRKYPISLVMGADEVVDVGNAKTMPPPNKHGQGGRR